MEPVRAFEGQVVALPINDIDTDQIIPARFLKTIDSEGLGKSLFADWRYEVDGRPKADFVLNQPQHAKASVLVSGDNFGCGSSREHAPWALKGAGFRAVVSTSFADIFRNNALQNRLLPLQVDEETQQQLISLAQEDASTRLRVDLERQTLTLPDGREVTFPIDAFSRHCLLHGIDQLGYLLGLDGQISVWEASHSARVNTLTPG